MTDRPHLFGAGTSLVWNASLRSLHVGLLQEGGAELAHEFWLGHPLETESGILTGAELFEHVWKERECTPLEYQLRVLDSVEAFCLHNGIPFLPFVRERVLRANNGSFLSPLEILSFVGRLLRSFVRSRDLHRTILESLDVVLNEMCPNVVTRSFGLDREGDEGRGWFMQVHDRDFSGIYPGFDASIWMALSLQLGPTRIGCEPFREVECRCEVRDLSHILEGVPKGLHPSRGAEGWMLDGRAVTRATTFLEWGRRQGLPLDDLGVPDHPVQEALEDIVCPVRNRVVVRAGCAYGAKAYLVRLVWRAGSTFSVEQGLAQLIGDATTDRTQAAERHEELLRRFRQKLTFVFHRRDATISCNGEHLLRGVPAKILQKVLMAHTLTNRVLFEHREFRRDPDLGLDPLNPNLEGRLRILSDRLEERLQGIRIVKNSRGRFELRTSTQVEFSEE